MVFRNNSGQPEAPKRHPGGTQEAPKAPGRLEAALEAKCAKTIVFVQPKSRERPFHLDGSNPTLTVCVIYCQKLTNVNLKISGR